MASGPVQPYPLADRIRTHYNLRSFKRAIRGELADLKYRLCITSFLLNQRCGKIDGDYLRWLQSKISDYSGSEPDERIREFVDKLLTLEPATLQAVMLPMVAAEGVGLSLKTFSASYFELNFGRIADLPDEAQTRCHEFRNHLHILNQEIEKVMDAHVRTFDSSLSSSNHERLVQDIQNRHLVISNMCSTVIEKIDSLQDGL